MVDRRATSRSWHPGAGDLLAGGEVVSLREERPYNNRPPRARPLHPAGWSPGERWGTPDVACQSDVTTRWKPSARRPGSRPASAATIAPQLRIRSSVPSGSVIWLAWHTSAEILRSITSVMSTKVSASGARHQPQLVDRPRLVAFLQQLGNERLRESG